MDDFLETLPRTPDSRLHTIPFVGALSRSRSHLPPSRVSFLKSRGGWVDWDSGDPETGGSAGVCWLCRAARKQKSRTAACGTRVLTQTWLGAQGDRTRLPLSASRLWRSVAAAAQRAPSSWVQQEGGFDRRCVARTLENFGSTPVVCGCSSELNSTACRGSCTLYLAVRHAAVVSAGCQAGCSKGERGAVGCLTGRVGDETYHVHFKALATSGRKFG